MLMALGAALVIGIMIMILNSIRRAKAIWQDELDKINAGREEYAIVLLASIEAYSTPEEALERISQAHSAGLLPTYIDPFMSATQALGRIAEEIDLRSGRSPAESRTALADTAS